MLWYIIVFSCVLVAFVIQQLQIDKINKRLEEGDYIIDKLREATLMMLRGTGTIEEFEEQTKHEHIN